MGSGERERGGLRAKQPGGTAGAAQGEAWEEAPSLRPVLAPVLPDNFICPREVQTFRNKTFIVHFYMRSRER